MHKPKILPRLNPPWLCTPLWMASCQWTWTAAVVFTLTIGAISMFTMINEIHWVAAISMSVVAVWIMCKQYSKYVSHKKAHVADEADSIPFKLANSFAVFPYMVIPLVFGALSVLASLFVTDWALAHAYIGGVEETVALAVVVSLLIYFACDLGLVAHLGDSVYFETVELKAFQHAVDAAEESEAVKKELTDYDKIQLLKEILGK